jgi:hypothetical protein
MADDVPLTGPSTEGNRLRLKKSTTGMLVVESALRSRGGGRAGDGSLLPASRSSGRLPPVRTCSHRWGACGQCAGRCMGRWPGDLASGPPSVRKRRMRPRVPASRAGLAGRRACAGAGDPVAPNGVRKRLKRVTGLSAQDVHRTDQGSPLRPPVRLPGDAPFRKHRRGRHGRPASTGAGGTAAPRAGDRAQRNSLISLKYGMDTHGMPHHNSERTGGSVRIYAFAGGASARLRRALTSRRT